MPSRRHVLELLTAAPLLASCGGGDLPDPAAAWRDPGAGETDPRRFALAHAILAPNPHNTQPWLVELDDADGMTLYCDLDRRLPFTDPLDRQITIGVGAFLELYRMAGVHLGRAPELELFPEGVPTPRLDGRPIARVRLPQANVHGEPLFAQISARRTNRDVYDDARVPNEEELTAVAAALANVPVQVGWTNEPARVAGLRNLVWRAFEREMQTVGALEETFQWLRFGRAEIARHRDGLSIDGPLIPLAKAMGQLDREDMIDPNSQSNRTALRDWRRKADSAPAFMWIVSADDSPISRILSGMAYALMNLTATSRGLAMHPWSQALQEYSKMADLYGEAREALGVSGTETVQMLVRVGYADPVQPAPRRGLEAHLRRA